MSFMVHKLEMIWTLTILFLDKQRTSTAFQRNFVYPIAMLLLLFLTGITVLIVVQNTLELLIGIKALPLSTRVRIFCYEKKLFELSDTRRHTHTCLLLIFVPPLL